MANFSASNEIAVLSAVRSPLWTQQSGYTGVPSASDAGVSVAGSVTTGWAVDLRPRTGTGAGFPGRQVVVTVNTVDDTATYTLTLGGTAINYVASSGDTAQDITDGLAAAIVANGTTNALVTATSASVSSVWTLTITGRAVDNYTFAVSTSGTGGLTCIADPDTASIRFWAYGAFGPANNNGVGGGASGQHWRLVGTGLTGLAIDYGGRCDILAVNFVSRYYIEAFSLTAAGDGAATSPDTLSYALLVAIGPAQPE